MSTTSSVTAKPGVSLKAAIERLISREVRVGIPDSTPPRPLEPGEKKPASNAVIGFIQEFGDDELKIPPRPFLLPGVEAVLPVIAERLAKAAHSALSGDIAQVDAALDKVGNTAKLSVQSVVRAGQFVPLSPRTIEARARRRNPETGKLIGRAANRDARAFLELQAQGVPDDILHSADFAKPLNDTLSLLGSITYIVMDKNK